MADTRDQWKSAFMCTPSCFCLKVCLCPCAAYGEIDNQLNNTGCCVPCLKFMCCAPCCGAFFIHSKTREQIRVKYNLQESCFNDTIATCCCLGSCALCQEKRELEARGDSGGAGSMAPTQQNMS